MSLLSIKGAKMKALMIAKINNNFLFEFFPQGATPNLKQNEMKALYNSFKFQGKGEIQTKHDSYHYITYRKNNEDDADPLFIIVNTDYSYRENNISLFFTSLFIILKNAIQHNSIVTDKKTEIDNLFKSYQNGERSEFAEVKEEESFNENDIAEGINRVSEDADEDQPNAREELFRSENKIESVDKKNEEKSSITIAFGEEDKEREKKWRMFKIVYLVMCIILTLAVCLCIPLLLNK